MVVDVDEPIPGQVFTLRDCFYMLLRARGGDFDARVPLRVSASPIEPSLRCFFVQSSEESKKVSKGRTSPTEICVKYNNTARSRVWWSPEHNHCLGFVIRKMGTKVRLPKDQPAGDLKHGFQGHWLVLLERSDPGPLREKAVVRTFVIETAPSMVQLWPTAPSTEANTMHERSPMPLSHLPLSSSLGPMHPTARPANVHALSNSARLSLADPPTPSFSSAQTSQESLAPRHQFSASGQGTDDAGSNDPLLISVNYASPSQVSQVTNSWSYPFPASASSSSSSSSSSSLSPSSSSLSPFHSSLHDQHGRFAPPNYSRPPMPSESPRFHHQQRDYIPPHVRNGSPPMPHPTHSRSASFPDFPHSLTAATYAPPTGSSFAGSAAASSSSSAASSAAAAAKSASSSSTTPTRPRLPPTYVGSSREARLVEDSLGSTSHKRPRRADTFADTSELQLLHEALADQNAKSHHRQEPGPPHRAMSSNSSQRSISSAPCGSTNEAIEDDELASAANVMAYEIFKTVCDTFSPEEFTKWYQLYSQTIFIPRIAIELKRNMDRDDPRLRQSFMFASQMQFLPNVPKGILMYKGSYVKGFVTTKQDATATQIMDGLIMEGADARLYEETQASKIMLLCQHLHFKQLVTEGSLNPSDYWFHNILRLPTGRLMILRGHTWTVSRSEDIASEVRRCEMQDVTAAFPDIMRLPPLE